jgi:geranylgeranyl diphosphate/geranylgeranyl-bacteriochlorophyllide a reductase
MNPPPPLLYDVVVIGGGPAGATAAHDLASAGRTVLLLDKAGRIKPCGGAVPPRLIKDFAIPDHLLVARARGARIVAPSQTCVDMPVGEGFVGMVDRDVFDEWLRERAAEAGAVRQKGSFTGFSRDDAGLAVVEFTADGQAEAVRARTVIGADGARSAVAKHALPGDPMPPCVFAYHEVIEAPDDTHFDGSRCDVVYQGQVSPDFYGWVFPHGKSVSVGTGSAKKGFGLRESVAELRRDSGLADCRTIRSEGAPIPLKPRKRWDNGRDTIVVGDAAGVVAPASGEGIYYAMASARCAATAVETYLATGKVAALKSARKTFMKAHGRVFLILRLMQYFWYSSDKRRERFVSMCADPDVQQLTWQAYMNKELVRAKPMAHARIFAKDLGHLLGSTA